MPLPVLLALAFAQGIQDPQVPAAPVQAPTNFTVAYEVLEPTRMAVTPIVDGKIEEEEWDYLGAAGTGKAFFQWEPGVLHIAGVVPEGRELLASFDLRQNGWLIGSDNLQLRISMLEGKPIVKARLVDGTRITGPTWIELPGMTMSSTAAARTEAGMTTFEASIADCGIGLIPVESGAKLAIRLDAPLASEANFEPFLPRVLTNVSLDMLRSAALPTGLKVGVEGLGKTVTPGETVRIRLTFNGNSSMNLNKLALRTEGFGRDVTNKLELPFPKFDNKGRAFVDYDTAVAATATRGYRVLKGELTAADGVASMLQSSYRIAPPLDFDLVRNQVATNPNDRSVKYVFYARSNSGKRITGNVNISIPEPLRILNGSTRKIEIAGRQRPRYDFEVFMPANTTGTFPVTFKSTLNGVTSEQVGYFTVGGI